MCRLEESSILKVEFIQDFKEDESSENVANIREDLQGQIFKFNSICDETSSMFGLP